MHPKEKGNRIARGGGARFALPLGMVTGYWPIAVMTDAPVRSTWCFVRRIFYFPLHIFLDDRISSHHTSAARPVCDRRDRISRRAPFDQRIFSAQFSHTPNWRLASAISKSLVQISEPRTRGVNDDRIDWAQISHSRVCELAVAISHNRMGIGGPCRDRTYDQRIKSSILLMFS